MTRQLVADQLGAYLRGAASLAALVDWAEQQMMDGDFETDAVRDSIARLGLADVRAFGLTWEDCQQILQRLGYAADIHIGIA